MAVKFIESLRGRVPHIARQQRRIDGSTNRGTRSSPPFAPCGEVFPTELDRPCNPKLPDLYPGVWSY